MQLKKITGVERRSVTSLYHGSRISGSEQHGVFATAMANSKKAMGLDWQTTLHVHSAFLYIS